MIQKIYTDKVVILVAVILAAIFVLGYDGANNKAAAGPLSYEWVDAGRVNGVEACVDTHNVVYRPAADTADGLCHLKVFVRLASDETIRDDRCVVEETTYYFDKDVKNIQRKVTRRVVAQYGNSAKIEYVDHKSGDIGQMQDGNRRIDENIILTALEAYKGRIIDGRL